MQSKLFFILLKFKNKSTTNLYRKTSYKLIEFSKKCNIIKFGDIEKANRLRLAFFYFKFNFSFKNSFISFALPSTGLKASKIYISLG